MTPFTSTAIKMDSKGLKILDQTQLPKLEVWMECPTVETMIQHIRELRVRGAPLIGVAASLQLGLLAEKGASEADVEKALWALREARPTAVNLMNCLDRMLRTLKTQGVKALPDEAEAICLEDVRLCERMAKNGAALIEDGDQLLTHCNTGGLATAGMGTALGVAIQAARDGKKIHVYVDETRPLLQGGRLNTWECAQHKIPYTLICDNMAAFLMQKGKVDRVLVGADRIARNGDFANKIGTYSLAVNCKFHGIPFYVVAPRTTVDVNCAHGGDIPVEERRPEEVWKASGAHAAPVWNPAFDVTPGDLVTAWILDSGVYDRGDVRSGALIG